MSLLSLSRTLQSILSLPPPSNHPLMPPNLPLGQRRDPTHRQTNRHMNTPDNPKPLGIVTPMVHEPKDDGKDNPPHIPPRARQPRQHPVRIRMHMRHQRKVRAVPGLEENRHQRHQPKHRMCLMGIQPPDQDQEHPRHEPAHGDPALLEPQAAPKRIVQHVRDHAAQRPRRKVEEPKHGRPVSRLRLRHGREVLEVVRRQDRIDGELAAERVHVHEHEEERLRGGGDAQGLAEGRLDDDFALGGLEHLVAGHVRLVVKGGRGDGARGGRELGLLVLDVAGGAVLFGVGFGVGGGEAVGDGARDDDNLVVNAVRGEGLLGLHMAVLPRARGRVGAEGEEADAREDDHDERDDEGEAPRLAGRKAALDERVEDDGHDEVRDAAAGVAEAARQRVGCADNVLVEEARRPHLTRNKRAPEDTDEEAADVEPGGVFDERGEAERDGAEEEEPAKDLAGAELVTQGTGDEADEETGWC